MRGTNEKHRRVMPDGSVEKFCRRCQAWKRLAQLTPKPRCRDGYCATCRDCTNALWKVADVRRATADERRFNLLRTGCEKRTG